MNSATSNEPTNPHASQPAEVLYVPYPRNGKISDSNLPTLGKPTGHQAEFEHNAEERCAVVLVLDISASMVGEPIRLLNEAVNKLHRNLLEDPLIAAKVDLGMVMFNHNVILPATSSTPLNSNRQPCNPAAAPSCRSRSTWRWTW